MRSRVWVLAFLLFLLPGCHSAQVVLFDGKEYPPTESVEVFSDLSTVNWRYVEIGYAEAEGSGVISVSKQTLLNDLKASAQDAGANALVKVEFSEQESEGSMRPRAKGIMIRYKTGPDGNFIPR